MKKSRIRELCKRSFAVSLAAVLCISLPQLTALADEVGNTLDTPADSDTVSTSSSTELEGATDGIKESKPDINEDGTDNSPEPTPWTETVGEGSNQVDVTVEPVATITPDGTEVTWSGTGENGNAHGKVEGEETTTNPTTSSVEKDIEISDTGAGKDGVNIEVTITTDGVNKDGIPKAPEGYGLKSDDGTTAVYTKVDKVGEDEITSEWTIAKVDSQEDANGKVITTYQVTSGSETVEWRVEQQKDSAGNVISTKTIKVAKDEDGNPKDEIVSSSSGKEIPVTTTDVLKQPKPDETYGNPVEEMNDNNEKVLTYTKTDEETNTIHKFIVTEIKDKAGNFIGYETVKSTETTTTEPWEDKDTESVLKPVAPDGYSLSENGSYQNADGATWTVTEIKDESGKLIGYETIEAKSDVTITTRETFSNGTKIATTKKSSITRETVTNTTPGEVDVTVGAVTEGADHGNLKTESLKPNMGWDPDNGTTNTTTDFYGWADNQTYEVRVNSSLNIRKGPSTSYGKNGSLKNGDKVTVSCTEVDKNGVIWGCIGDQKWISLGYANVPKPDGHDEFSFDGGYGLSSAITVSYTGSQSGNKYNVHQFVVYDADGKPHYAYCADLSVSPNKVDYGMTNVEDSGFYDSENAAQISAIAVNGYWGTESGTGSLDAFKDWLVGMEYVSSKDDLKWLSGGMAMSITQAAIWYYGSSGNLSIADNPFVYYEYNGQYYQYANLPKIGVNSENETQNHVKSIYDFLIKNSEKVKNSNNMPSSNLIGAESVNKVSVAVGSRIEDLPVESNEKSDSPADIYNTDVTFYLDVTPSQINDDLIVRVYDVADPSKVLYTYRLEGAEEGNNGRNSEKRGIIRRNDDGSYTLKNLQLENGVEVTLQITGTQTVSKSAYLISATGGYDASQTFISVEEGKRSFDLKMNIKLDVQKGKATVETEKSEVNRSETQWSWSSDSEVRYDYPPVTPTPTPPSNVGDDDAGDDDADTDDDVPTPQSDDPGDEIPDGPVPLAEIPEEPVPLADIPLTVELAEIPDEDVPLAGLTDILDEDVPLADVPETGDISILWYALIIVSGSCLAALKIMDAKKRKESLMK